MDEVHVHAKSKLVAMGVSVAAMFVGDLVTSHGTRANFEVAKERLMQRGPRPVGS